MSFGSLFYVLYRNKIFTVINMDNKNTYFSTIKNKGVPDFKRGLGYSPAAGPPVGGPILPGSFFQYNIDGLIPRSSGKYSFGKYNPVLFPNLGGFTSEIGPGNTAGGEGGVNGPLHYLPAPLVYWNYFGKPKSRKSKKPKSRKSKNQKVEKVKKPKSRKSRKSRKSKK